MSRHIDRIRADQELRLFDLHLVASSVSMGGNKEMIDNYRAMLLEQRGMIVRMEEKISSESDIMNFLNMSQ